MAITFTQLAAASADTSNTTSYAGNAGTPAAGDLLLCFVVGAATLAAGSMTGTWTWRKLTSLGWNTIASPTSTLYVFWAVATAATSTTPTFDCTGDAATGAMIYCLRVTGAEGMTAPSVRQIATNGGSVANPQIAFTSNILSVNGVVALAANGTGSSTQWGAPSGWAENAETNITSPAVSLEVASRSSGETQSSLTWTNANTTPWGIVGIELWAPEGRPREHGGAVIYPL
jgi:hypothetical protein